MVRFILYLVRWQLSTPILAPIVALYTHQKMFDPTQWLAAGVANLIGGCIFFWVDRFIFNSSKLEQWELMKSGECYDCGKTDLVRRLVKAPGGYDRSDDSAPQYRCKECSEKKLNQLLKDGKVTKQ
ncbi:MAG: hypothetical protein WCO98_11090 [bacterium]